MYAVVELFTWEERNYGNTYQRGFSNQANTKAF